MRKGQRVRISCYVETVNRLDKKQAKQLLNWPRMKICESKNYTNKDSKGERGKGEKYPEKYRNRKKWKGRK